MAKIINLDMSGTPLTISTLPQHEWFWEEIQNGQWEANTLKVLADRITPETLYIDIGTWIGPTVLFAGARAKRVIGVEPDAIAMSALMVNLSLNPHVQQKVSLHNHALSAEGGVLELWSYEFGNSMTTSIVGRGSNKMTFLSMGVEEFLDSAIGDESHVFIKVDIESGEYTAVPALCEALKKRGIKADLYVSFHASLMVDESRSMRSWSANLTRNALLLEALCEYGTLHSFNGEWVPVAEQPGKMPEFSSWMDTGGTDQSFLIVAN